MHRALDVPTAMTFALSGTARVQRSARPTTSSTACSARRSRA
jgi:hypothetical protein